MKGSRMFFPILTWLVTSACLQVALEVAQEAPPRTSTAAEAATAPVRQTKEEASREDVIRELRTILCETTSPDTFCITITMLQKLKADSPELIPVIIRNAERLGIFRDVIVKGGKKNQAAMEAIDGVADILDYFAGQVMGDDDDLPPPPFQPAGRRVERVGVDFNFSPPVFSPPSILPPPAMVPSPSPVKPPRVKKAAPRTVTSN